MKPRPTICILDDNKERCQREERALDAAIAEKKLSAAGISNFGACHLARTGLEGKFPVIDVDGTYFMPKNTGEELTFEMLCDFLDMLVRKGVIEGGEAASK